MITQTVHIFPYREVHHKGTPRAKSDTWASTQGLREYRFAPRAVHAVSGTGFEVSRQRSQCQGAARKTISDEPYHLPDMIL